MSIHGADAQGSTAVALAKAEVAKSPVKPEVSNVTTTSAPISKWPWWATFIVALVLLGGVGFLQWTLWEYIRGADETLEKEDFEQLKGVADNVQTIAILLVGAIFGVGATQGVAAGAAKAADENKKAAETANATANSNAAAADTNLQRADSFRAVSKELAATIANYASRRKSDDSAYVLNVTSLVKNAADLGQVPRSDLAPSDGELDQMAADSRRILDLLDTEARDNDHAGER